MAKLMHSKKLEIKSIHKKDSFDHLRHLEYDNIFIILSPFGYKCNFECERDFSIFNSM